jgi:hypothetical protein
MVMHQGTFISLQHKKKATGGVVCNNEFFLDEKYELKIGENSDTPVSLNLRRSGNHYQSHSVTFFLETEIKMHGPE